ncbi:TPA: hypothetical protein ACH3X3_012549 [Trebouxia sp. C0006]
MKQHLCWEQLPFDVLKLIFEIQANALDNCAAACTCKAWRDAVHSSQIHELRLHATSASDVSRWAAFLTAPPAIHHLRLTSVFDQDKSLLPAKLIPKLRGGSQQSCPIKLFLWGALELQQRRCHWLLHKCI